ncbi:hypothetical protein C2I36_00235 [Rhodobacteraceae bacterium WD3A24]|nr:hypothetical protein C2I36_00235 [Rhodobacteraceae bacterium WD3A24]
MSAAAIPVRLFDRLVRLLVWVAAALAATIMFVTFADVIMRYIFRSPITGSFEITEISMGLIVFFAMPQMIRNRGNIVVTVMFDKFARPVQRAATVLTEALAAGISGFVAWRIWLQGERMMRYGEVTMELRIPKGLIAQSMAVLMAVAGVAFLICTIEVLRRDDGDTRLGREGL